MYNNKMAAFIGAFVETALVVSELATVGMALGYGAKKGYDFAKSKKESRGRIKKSADARLVDDSDLSDYDDCNDCDDHKNEDDSDKETKTIEVLGIPVYDRKSSTENNSRTVKVLGITVYNCKDTTTKNTNSTNSKKNV
jgi:hypothetical protein